MAMTLVSTVTVGSGGAASIEFTGIAGTGKDLLLLMSIRSNRNVVADVIGIQFNGETATANYSNIYLLGSGEGTASGSLAQWVGHTSDASNTVNTFGNTQIYVANYAGSTAKSYAGQSVSENNATAAYQDISANNWNNTNAITSVKLIPLFGTNFVQHSTASLYIIS